MLGCTYVACLVLFSVQRPLDIQIIQGSQYRFLYSRRPSLLNVNLNSSKNETYGISCFNTLKAEEKLSILLNFVFGRSYYDEILITLRWRSLGGNFGLFCLQDCSEKLAAERGV